MSDEQITFEGTKYGGVVKVKAASTSMGEEKKLPRGSELAFVGRGAVVGVAFREAAGINVREHITSVEDLRVVPDDVVADIIEELREEATGQARLLSVDGESRRAGRRVVRARGEAIEAGQSPQADDELDVPAFLGAIETLLGPAAETDRIVDDFESPELFYDALEDNFVAIAERAVAAVESMHRRRAAAIEQARLDAEEAERERARAAAQAAAVSDDPVADSEAAALNRDDGMVSIGDAIEEAGYSPDDDEDEPPGGDDEQPYPEHLEERLDEPEDREETPQASTPQQRVAISKQIMAMSGSDRLAAEWAEWCDSHGVPRSPGEMTFEQARDALIFMGDAEHATVGAGAN